MNDNHLAGSAILNHKLELIRQHFQSLEPVESGPAVTLILSCSSGKERARVMSATASNALEAWRSLDQQLCEAAANRSDLLKYLLVERVIKVTSKILGQLKQQLASTKANHFSRGIALDGGFAHFFLNAELNGNAMLFDGALSSCAVLNPGNFKEYGQRKYGPGFQLPTKVNDDVFLFNTLAVFCDENDRLYQLDAKGPTLGCRQITAEPVVVISDLIVREGAYLANQLNAQGRFRYQVYPCFNRESPQYSMQDHALAAYALLQVGKRFNQESSLLAAKRALTELLESFVQTRTFGDQETAAFVWDAGDEYTLNGASCALLALTCYTEVYADRQHLAVMEQLARGMLAMFNPSTKRFVQVLNASNLSVKQQVRDPACDCRAALALLRLYKLNRRILWLQAVETIVDYRIANPDSAIKDLWLKQCLIEIQEFRAYPRYAQAMSQLQPGWQWSNLHLLEWTGSHAWPERAIYYDSPDLVTDAALDRDHAFGINIGALAARLLNLIDAIGQLQPTR